MQYFISLVLCAFAFSASAQSDVKPCLMGGNTSSITVYNSDMSTAYGLEVELWLVEETETGASSGMVQRYITDLQGHCTVPARAKDGGYLIKVKLLGEYLHTEALSCDMHIVLR